MKPGYILLVEDDETKARAVTRLLIAEGYEYRHALNLADFEKMLSEERPIAVITDWQFPLGRAPREDDPSENETGSAVTAICAEHSLSCLVYSGAPNPGPDALNGAIWGYGWSFRQWLNLI